MVSPSFCSSLSRAVHTYVLFWFRYTPITVFTSLRIRLFFNGMLPCIRMYSSSEIILPQYSTVSLHWSPKQYFLLRSLSSRNFLMLSQARWAARSTSMCLPFSRWFLRSKATVSVSGCTFFGISLLCVIVKSFAQRNPQPLSFL